MNEEFNVLEIILEVPNNNEKGITEYASSISNKFDRSERAIRVRL